MSRQFHTYTQKYFLEYEKRHQYALSANTMGANRTMLNIQARAVISLTLSKAISPRETQPKWLQIHKRWISPMFPREITSVTRMHQKNTFCALDIFIKIMNYILDCLLQLLLYFSFIFNIIISKF